MLNWHRIFSGNPEHSRELFFAGMFVLVWFVMDTIEFVDWAVGKFSNQTTAICVPVGAFPIFTPTQGTIVPAK